MRRRTIIYNQNQEDILQKINEVKRAGISRKKEATATDGPLTCPVCGKEYKMPGYRMHVKACKKKAEK